MPPCYSYTVNNKKSRYSNTHKCCCR